MSGELAERDGGRAEDTEQKKKNGMEGGRRYFRDTNPISIFLGMGRCLDLAVARSYLSFCGWRMEGFLGPKLGLH